MKIYGQTRLGQFEIPPHSDTLEVQLTIVVVAQDPALTSANATFTLHIMNQAPKVSLPTIE